MDKGTCSIEDCGRPARTRGWCGRHYQRWCNHGDPLCLKQVRKLCTVESCDGYRLSRGLCGQHHHRRLTDERNPPAPLALPGERWAPIPGHAHEASDHGRVRSPARTTTDSIGRTSQFRARVLIGRLNAYGYRVVSLGKKGHSGNFMVHRLVLEAFVGPCPEGMETRHLNGDRVDNRLENLTWGTPFENAMDRQLHGTDRHAAQTHCNRDHSLSGPNLSFTVSPNGRPGRYCVACSRGRSYIRRNRTRGIEGLDMQVIADMYYAELIANAA